LAPTTNTSRCSARSPGSAGCAYTIAAEIGDITRFPTPRKVGDSTGLCPRVYRDRYQNTKARLGKQRGAKVAQIDLEAIWHMLSRSEPFAPKSATDLL
jgi:transposase